MHIFLLPVVQFIHLRLFWCTLPSFGGISCRDVCLLSNIMELDGTLLEVLRVPENNFFWHPEHSTVLSLSKNHNPGTQDISQTLL